MKKRFLSFGTAAILAISFTACNDTGTTAGTSDSISSTTTSTNTAPVTTNSSASNYAAMADSVDRNSRQGYYLNPKTGKPYKALKVDLTTGSISDEAGEPVWRYVDNRNWWVYGGDNWGQMGEARMEGDKLMYKGESDKWVTYDDRWMKDDEEMKEKWKVSDNGMKQKMTTEDGDKIKIKTDKDGNTKIKVNGEKVKVDKDGKEIKN